MEAVMTFRDAHRVIRAEGVLLAEGVPVRVMPLPPAIRAGCGLCLRVAPERAAAALELLERSDAAPESLYRRRIVAGTSVYEPDPKEAG